ncbi:MAG: DNA-formamidopyrimidine glycosylase family protein, partial [Ilumatobacteraceae bacterium]
MPEGLEAEIYRRAAEGCVGRRIRSVDIDARQAMAVEVAEAMPGCIVRAARRIGKLVVIDTERPVGRGATRRWTRGPSLGLHFGMTGRLIVDDR